MRRVAITILILFAATLAFAAGWKKPYFGATKPGTWVKYADHSDDIGAGGMTSIYARPEDEKGRVRIDITIEFAGGNVPALMNRYALTSGFSVDDDLIDFGQSIEAAAVGSGPNDARMLDAAAVNAIVNASALYGPNAVFAGTEKIDGRTCDHYTYTIKRPQPPSVETGSFWLDASVPFGVVKQTFTKKVIGGKTTTFERKLIASGTGDPPPATAPVSKLTPAKPAGPTLKEAFDSGLIAINATVDQHGKDGEKVHLHIDVKEDKLVTVIVPQGKTTLTVGPPLDEFNFEVASAQTLLLNAGRSGDLDVKQLGQKRALEGTFRISVYQGTPLWSGSATVGVVK